MKISRYGNSGKTHGSNKLHSLDALGTKGITIRVILEVHLWDAAEWGISIAGLTDKDITIVCKAELIVTERSKFNTSGITRLLPGKFLNFSNPLQSSPATAHTIY